ncbi:DMT family transporter [Hydrogenovibrio halophilus]|uniref:DMT family transporter n=1 Tax=Hydrogenovibrio halophilus TaxID=373391 RepID=UPI0003765E03|nr:DMT family transporter [Hydrogenovibrio halophilus]
MSQSAHRSQKQGEAYAIALSVIEAHFPIFAFFAVAALGALHAYFYSLVIATVLLIGWVALRGKLKELTRTQAWRDLALTSLFITTLFSLIFLALNHTSPSHVAIILFMQVLFSYLFLGRRWGETLDRTHLIGVVLMTVGALIILFPGKLTLNPGDGLALMAAIIAPFANLFQKKARTHVSSETILMVRSLIALPVLYLLAQLFEPAPAWPAIEEQLLWLFLIGGGVFVVSKIFWIEALHRLPITKVNALFALSPLLTMGLAWWILQDAPTWTQVLGAFPVLVGGFFITRKAT